MMSGGTKQRPAEAGRVRELDGLRGLAVLAVMVHHYGLLSWGFLGVDVFFVLSGYLITGILVRGIDLRTFYRRRAVRLLPALALMLLVVGPFMPLPSVIASATYMIDLTMALHLLPVVPSLGHLWSLAIEWQFYLIWPVVLLFALRRWSRERVAIVTLILASLSLGWAIILGRDDWLRVWTAPDTHATTLLVGSAFALLGFGVPRFRPLTWLAPIGTISYGLYLWHIPIWVWLNDVGDNVILPSFLLAFVVAGSSWRYLEAPLLRGRATRPSTSSGRLAIALRRSSS